MCGNILVRVARDGCVSVVVNHRFKRHRDRCALLVLLAMFAGGCNGGPHGGQSQLTKARSDQAALAQQNNELRSRVAALDQDNQQRTTIFAQSQQQVRQREEELAAVRAQLGEATAKLSLLQGEKQESDQKVDSLLASSRRGGGASIRANNSLNANLPNFNRADITVRPNGDVVRIAILSDSLFRPGSAQILPTADALLDTVAFEIARRYPNHRIGIEGHTAAISGVAGGRINQHQLSVSQATVVFGRLVARGRLSERQLFIVGHGGNYPVYSNAHPDGMKRNRRIELVVYPEKIGS